MSIGLTDDQIMLKDNAERFIREAYAFEERQKLVQSALGIDPAHWQTFAELGWLAAPFSEQVGGLGLSTTDIAVFVEQLGRGLYVGPYWSSVLFAGQLIERLATAEQSTQLLAPIMNGTGHVFVAWMEPASRYSLDAIATQAVPNADGFTLTGTKRLAPWAHLADILLVTAQTNNGFSLFAVPRNAEGIEERVQITNDGNRASDIVFSDVQISTDALVGPDGGGFEAFVEVADIASLYLAVEATGCVGALHDQTLGYIKQREQFGRPISKFQVVQHAMVDINIHHQTLQSMAFAVAHHTEMQIKQSKKQQMISAAKAQAGWVGRAAAETAFQLHGAIAMSDDLPIGHYLKRLTCINATLGDADYHQRRFLSLDKGETVS